MISGLKSIIRNRHRNLNCSIRIGRRASAAPKGSFEGASYLDWLLFSERIGNAKRVLPEGGTVRAPER